MAPSTRRPPVDLRTIIKPVFAQTPTPSRNPFLKSVDGYGSFIWTGSNEGRVKGFGLRPSTQTQTEDTDACCFQDTLIFPPSEAAARPKAVERILLIPVVSTAVILSEGSVTFHSIENLELYPQPTFPVIRGVSALTLDEDTFDFPSPTSHGSGQVTICAIKKKTIHLYSLHETGVQQVLELPFASAAFNGILRRSVLLLSDVEQYYLVLLNQSADLIPLLPVSQSSSLTPREEAPPPSSRHRPSMSSIPNSEEFLIASHTGPTCLGVFVSSTGDPSRGTLEWPSNPRSVSVNQTHVLALLLDGNIQVHSLETQDLVQVITVSPGVEPRALSPARFNVSLPGETFQARLQLTTVRLSELPPPQTPPMHRSTENNIGPLASTSNILLMGRDSVHAICSFPLLSEVESLLSQNKWDEALHLAEPYISSPTPPDLREQLRYIFQKIALICVLETRFEEAAELWFRGAGDPRILVRLFPQLRCNVLAKNDELQVFEGLRELIRDVGCVDELVMANLVRNYSPHLKPSIDQAPATVDLKLHLISTSRLMLLRYLRRWKRDRLSKGGANHHDRHLDSVVDTALVELLAEGSNGDEQTRQELSTLLDRPNACIREDVEIVLEKNKCYGLLAGVFFARGEFEKALEIWSKLHDKEWMDPSFHQPLERISNLLQKLDQPNLVSRYAVWLTSHDLKLALRVLLDSKAADSLDVRSTLAELEKGNPFAAQLYLEHLVLRPPGRRKKRPLVLDLAGLRTSLIVGYLATLKSELLPASNGEMSAIGRLFRSLVEAYVNEEEKVYDHLAFVDHLLDIQAVANSDAVLTRLKLILCLDQAADGEEAYDVPAVRRALEEMGGAPETMAFERAMVFSKLGLHRLTLSLLAVTLRDLRSSERYCLRPGVFLTPSQIRSIVDRTALSAIPTPPRSESGPNEGSSELLLILIELALPWAPPNLLGPLLARHTPGLVLAHQTLPVLVQKEWALESVGKHLGKSLRFSAHCRLEGKILKAVAGGMEFGVAEVAARRWWVQREERPGERGATLDEEGSYDQVGGQRKVMMEELVGVSGEDKREKEKERERLRNESNL